jgi:hypothetical protein
VELERSLLEGLPLPSLYLPGSEGGRIEQIRDTVWRAIEAHVSLDYGTERAEEATRGAGEADRLLEAGDYAAAFGAYTRAFRALLPTTPAVPERVEDLSQLQALPVGEIMEAARTPSPLLSPPLPNPATGQVAYSVNLSNPAPVRVRVHDVSGRLIEELVNASLDPGQHDFVWEGASAPSGVYFLNVEAGELRASRQVVIVR